jgi:DNA-binding IclR family transcriptional regulator
MSQTQLSRDRPKGDGASSLVRAVQILDAIAEGPEAGRSASELAAATGINRVTVHRILGILKGQRLVRQSRPREPYRLGFRLVELAQRVLTELELVRAARPVLAELSHRSSETSHLAVLDGQEAVYVAKVEPSHTVRLVSRVGNRVPLHSTALGRALLAAMESDETEALLSRLTLEPRTPRTIRSIAALRAEIEATRTRGFAIDCEENEVGVRCVATAVSSPVGSPLAAVSISGPESRIPDKRFEELGTLVVEAADEISDALRT